MAISKTTKKTLSKTSKPASSSKSAAAPAKTVKKAAAAAPVKAKKSVKEVAPVKTKKVVAPAKAEKKVVKTSTAKTAAVKSSKTAKAAPAKKAAPARGSHFDITPIKNRLGKTELINTIAENCELEPRIVKKVFAQFEQIVLGSIMKKGAGEFMWPGIAKIVTKHIPAQKGGVKKPNPFKPGEMMVTKAKPATVRVRIRALAKLKKAAVA